MVAPFIFPLRSGARSFTVAAEEPGADASIATVTITNGAASTKTNEIVSFGFPLGPTELGSGQVLRVYDDNGSGAKGTVLANFQIDGLSTDLNAAKRFARLTGIVPSLGSSATRKLFVEASSTAAPTGTTITAAELLATDFRVLVTINIAGTAYTVDSDDLLAAGSTVSKTAAYLVSAYAGPTNSEWLAVSPPMNGGSPHASGDGLRVFMSIRAFKAGTAAVDGGNPITLAWADVWVENGDLTRVSPAHYYYSYLIQRSTSLSDGTLISTDDTDPDGNVIRYSYARSQPAVTLTATGFTSTGAKTWTRASGSWDTDILGAHITGDSGAAIVTARTNNTTIEVYVYDASASLTSLTSGNWTIEGIGHHYNVTLPKRRVWVGNKPTNVAAWGDNDSAITPSTRAPMTRLAATMMSLNIGTTYAGVTHTTTEIDLMRASDGSRRPLTFLGPVLTNMGELETSIGQAGWEPAIGPNPTWVIDGIVKYTAPGRRRIFENAEYWSTWQYHVPRRYSGSPSAGSLGTSPRADNGTSYHFNPAQGDTTIAVASTSWWPYDADTAHHSASCYIPYLLTGDLYWLSILQRQAIYSSWACQNDGYSGVGANKTSYGDATGVLTSHMGEHQTRGKAWSSRDDLYATICTPDSLDEKIANSKTYNTARISKMWLAAATYGPNDILGVHSGADEAPQWLNATLGHEYTLQLSNEYAEAPWQVSFNHISCGIARELGLQDANGVAFQAWLAKGARDMVATNNSLVRDVMVSSYWLHLKDETAFTGNPTSWEQVYQRSCLVKPLDFVGVIEVRCQRTPSGSVTLSDASIGNGRTMTFANDYFSNGGSWYENGYIRDVTNGGVFKITAVSGDGLVLTGDISTAFAVGTSLTASQIRIPGPHRLDYTGDHENTAGSDYPQFFVAGCRLALDAGILTTEMTNAISYVTGRTGYSEVRPQFDIDAR